MPRSVSKKRLPAQAALATLAALLASAAVHAEERVRIGLMSPLTGPQAAYGIDHRDAAAMAIKEINAKGLKVGGKAVVLELEAHDDQADPKQGVQVAQALVDGKIKFVLGPYNSGVAIPSARVFAEGGVLVFTVASNPKVTQQGHPNLFRIGASDSELGRKMAIYATFDLKARRVAVIDDRTAYGQGLAHEFSDQAKVLGLQVVAREFTTDKATDFSTILTNVRAARPDAIFYGGYYSQAGPMLRQMRGLGLQAPLMGGDGICSTETANLAQWEGELNAYCAQGGGILGRSDKGRQFIDRYQAAFKRAPLTSYAASFYDGVHLLAAAMEATKSTAPDKIQDHIAKGRYLGVAGEYVYDAKHDLRSSAVTIFRIKTKELVALKSL